MKRIIATIIFFSLLYFLIGLIAVYFSFLSSETYLFYGSIIGSIISILSLFSFIRPSISNDDIRKLELESIQSIKKNQEKLQVLENESSQTQQRIGQLEIQKKEMELLVKKASLSLFLKEQHEYHTKAILKYIDTNLEIKDSLKELHSINQKLSILEVEIESDPNVSLLKEIIHSTSYKRSAFDIIEAWPYYLVKAIVNLILTILSPSYIKRY